MQDQCTGEIVNGQVVYGKSSCGYGMVCCGDDMNYKIQSPLMCGFQNTYGAGFYGEAQGNNVQFAEYPWMASIEEGYSKICSGSVIAENVVITSASCVNGKNKDSLKVRLGSWTTSSSRMKPQTEEIRGVDKIIIDQDQYGLALIVLKTSVNLNMYISPVCLPPADENFTGHTCKVVGWENGNLKKTDVRIQACIDGNDDKTFCAQTYENIESGASLICKIVTGENSEEYTSFQQFGIALPSSSGIKTFVNTAKFRRWVDSNIKNEGYEVSTYSFVAPKLWGGVWRAFSALVQFGIALYKLINK